MFNEDTELSPAAAAFLWEVLVVGELKVVIPIVGDQGTETWQKLSAGKAGEPAAEPRITTPGRRQESALRRRWKLSQAAEERPGPARLTPAARSGWRGCGLESRGNNAMLK